MYSELAEGQSPDALVFACADSRIIPSELARTGPGQLFNVGNLVPPADTRGASKGDLSEASAIDYAVGTLGVDDVGVCGHSSCGAMGALLAGGGAAATNLDRWLIHARPALDAARVPATIGRGRDAREALSQRSVLVQLEHLRTYPLVAHGRRDGRVRMHAWWFDIRRDRPGLRRRTRGLRASPRPDRRRRAGRRLMAVLQGPPARSRYVLEHVNEPLGP